MELKIIGNYEFGAISKSDNTKLALGFKTLEEAQNHVDNMNKELENFNESKWSMKFWKQKPEEWIVVHKKTRCS